MQLHHKSKGKGKHYTLTVTGTLSPPESFLTILSTKSRSSIRKAPYFPLLAILWGQPKLRSTASHLSSTNWAAFNTVSGSLAQNCTNNGLQKRRYVDQNFLVLCKESHTSSWTWATDFVRSEHQTNAKQIKFQIGEKIGTDLAWTLVLLPYSFNV